MIGDHTCEFSRPDYTCPDCGLFVAEYLDDVLSRCVSLENSSHKLRTENAALKARLAAAERVIERLGRCGRVTAQFDFGMPEGVKVAAIYRWDEFDKVKEAIAAYDAESK